MDEQKVTEKKDEDTPEVITPWYILTLIKPIIREEFIAKCRFDRAGIKLSFCNGQKFRVKVEEIK